MERFWGILFALVLVFSLVTIGLASPVLAATFTVNSTGDATDANPGDGVAETAPGNGVCTLRAAIQETNALVGPDIINLPAGSYTLNIAGTGEDAAVTGDLDITDDLTIIGADKATTIIDGGALDRVLHIIGGSTVEISGVTIQNGRVSSIPGAGGGIHNDAGTLKVTQSTIINNIATYGGGLNGNGPIQLIETTVSSNAASERGGGIYINSGTVTLTNSEVSENTANGWPNGHGGGIYNWSGSVTVVASTVRDNRTTGVNGSGGGIYNGSGSVTLTDSTVSNNVAKWDGGGICSFAGPVTITRSTVNNNSAGSGGGIVNANDRLTLTNSTVSGNMASGSGGGIINGGNVTTLVLSSSTITGNMAGGTGGGIYNVGGGTATTKNTIIANNTGSNCGGVGVTSLGHNLDSNGTCGLSGPGDISVVVPLLGPLADNGGPTSTHALLPGSPAIDAGNNADCPPTDQRGVARPLDGDGDSDAICDIGAYEYVPPPSEVWVDDNYTPGGYNDGHTWGYDAFAKIQDGIDAVAGSVVHVAAGTYYENITLVEGVQVLGAGADVTTIDGGGVGPVVTAIGVSPETVLDGFTITGGNATNGGGMSNDESLPTVNNCTFSNNSATDDGGGMYNRQSSPTVTDCHFYNNSASNGGGMFNHDSSPIVTHCTFSSNSGGWGGAVHNGDHSSPMVTHCTFSSNSASNGGGGMFNADSSPTVTNCTFSSNRARIFGGGMQNSNSSPTVTNCAFSANSAGSGGGMKNINSSPTVTNCTFFDNLAGGWGGGMNNEESSPMVINCTFSSNSAIVGSGIFDGESSPTVTNCILWDNGEEIANDVASTPLVTYCDVQGGYFGEGNIDADPLFVDPGNGDYHLQAVSPCIDAGTDTGAPSEDIEGNVRPIDGNGDSVAVTDMGAYEYVPSIEPAIDATIVFNPNTLNLGSKGKWVTTYIELQEGYDVNDINVGTILLNDSLSAELKPVAVGDHDGDGVPDLMVKFNRASVQGILTAGDEVEVTVTGELADGTPFGGSDTIRVISKGKK